MPLQPYSFDCAFGKNKHVTCQNDMSAQQDILEAISPPEFTLSIILEPQWPQLRKFLVFRLSASKRRKVTHFLKVVTTSLKSSG